MYLLNKRMLLCCCHKTTFLNCLMFNRGVDELNVRFSTCSGLKMKKQNIIKPIRVQPPKNTSKVGQELTGKLKKLNIVEVLNAFFKKPEVKTLSNENGIDDRLYEKGMISFRKYCLECSVLPPDLHITISDVINKAGNSLDLFPFFLNHIREIFPHLECVDDLKKIGDIREPANWYPGARKLNRKFIFHSGPTNSGKTHQAFQSFLKAKSGVYCAPLKLLAVEIHQKSNREGTVCDLLTGEEVIFMQENKESSSHVACTIEMCPLDKTFDVAIIDEIQMLRDIQRGWAWTRALLGLQAKEIHICGEETATYIVESILCTTNEQIEKKKYKRLTELIIDNPLVSLKNVCDGDCIVCFNKNDIYSVAHTLESLGKKFAIIYGGLPPQTKLLQCEKFNNPNDPCNILIATDAVGMGLNLNIRRIVFYSLLKVVTTPSGETEKGIISVSQALQIAGRAGRFNTQYDKGYVTTFNKDMIKTLGHILSQKPEDIIQAGLLPTADQIELFSFYLPKSSLFDLVEIFYNLCTVDDSLYFMCDMKDFKLLAQLIDHILLPLKVKFIFCCAPVNKKLPLVCVMFVRFAKMYSLNQAVTMEWIKKKLEVPIKIPTNLQELALLEATHEVLELYLWLSYRFEEFYPDSKAVKELQIEIDGFVQKGVQNFTSISKEIDIKPEQSLFEEVPEAEKDK